MLQTPMENLISENRQIKVLSEALFVSGKTYCKSHYMKEIIEYLKESKFQYLATVGLDEKPKIRPFQFMFEQDGKLWFCTSNQKEVFRELQRNPNVEICVSGENMSWLRLEGEVVFENNLRVKQRVMDESPLVKGIYKKANNPMFEVFYLKNGSAVISAIGKQIINFSF